MTDSPLPPEDKTRIRDASTLLLVRRTKAGPEVLMGQRGAGAAFMPSKFVFPGGAVDLADAVVPLAAPIRSICESRLEQEAPPGLTSALTAAAVRELWEETGLMLGAPGAWPGEAPDEWQDFAHKRYLPSASALTFVFRAITPPGRPRRFDARFFLADVEEIIGDANDFSRACTELSHLHWVPMSQARQLSLPFITEVVLAEVAALIGSGKAAFEPPPAVPFFDNSGPRATFRRLL